MSAASRSADFRVDIQGLRAIAVTAVLLYHGGVSVLGGGFVGVDVFFVVSGFLITAHLMREIDGTGRVRLGAFYARRARRLLPAAFAVLLVSLAAGLLVLEPLRLPSLVADAIATALYVPNVLFAVQGTDYLASTDPSLFQHYWSLGVEEQFYLVWPLLLVLIARVLRSRRARLTAVGALSATSFALGAALTASQQPVAFFMLPTRAWELGAGAMIALLLSVPAPRWARLAAPAMSWIGVAGIVASAVLISDAVPFPGTIAAIPVAATAAVLYFGSVSAGKGAERILGARPVQYVGRISYALYLVHWPVLVLVAEALDAPLPGWLALALTAASVPLAHALHVLVEVPGMRSPRLVALRPSRQLLLAGAASVAIVGLAWGSLEVADRQPLHVEATAAEPSFGGRLAATPFVPADLEPSLRMAADDNPFVYADGCHRSFASSDGEGCRFGDGAEDEIALFGDSHAAQWAPALLGVAERADLDLVTFTKSSCPSIDAPILRDGSVYASCSEWREEVLRELEAMDPSLIVLSNFEHVSFAAPTEDSERQWYDASLRMIEQLEEIAPVAVIADTPQMSTVPAVCLSSHLDRALDCATRADAALDSPMRDETEAAAERADAQFVDLTDVLCDATCPAILGDELVYRDSHHLTETFSESLSGTLGARLELPASALGR